MRRAADFLVRNWPLKLGAIFLATVLYSGLVLGQNVRSWSGTVPIDPIRPPAGAVLGPIPPVTLVRYRAPLDIAPLSPESFRASINLSGVQPQPDGPPTAFPVTLVAVDQRIQIVDFQPQTVEVQLDPVAERDLPVTVSLGTVPEGIDIGTPQVDPSSVTVRGASSRVDSVASVLARVAMDASALNIDREIDLVPVDANGNEVPNVTLEPERARVRVAVARQLANATVPVVPQLTGAPAAGYRVASVTVEPLVVTVSGEAAAVSQLQNLMTEPIDVTGRTSDLEASVRFAVPDGVSVTGSDVVRVLLTITQEAGTQTFQTGVALEGSRSDLRYELATSQVQVVLGGPLSSLSDVDPAGLVVTADVSTLTSGSRDVSLSLIPPPGVDVVSITPETTLVTVVPETLSPAVTPAQ